MTQIKIIKLEKDGCPPCKWLGRTLADNAARLESEGATLTTMNISENPSLIDEYKITSVPVLVFKRNGVEMTRVHGNVNFDDVLAAIEYAKFKI
ncbi:thioredoxin family protein [Lysinibacillus sp. TE18511]